MCGISVLINPEENINPALLEKMNQRIRHRGPDDSGVYTDGRVGFGHQRLSIIDLSSAGHQPMHYGSLVITYNGEIYNYIELREELRQKGYTFSSATDTEVILAAYAEWGKACFSKLNGMWAFAIYDKLRGEVILCRDHYGIKPLQYTFYKGSLAVCSEIKQLLDLPGFKPLLNLDVTASFLQYGSLNHHEETFFQGVQELRAGHSLTYKLENNTYQVEQWYNIADTPSIGNISYQDAQQEMYRLLCDSLRLRIRSDVKVGSCLSGGIDSSSMVSALFSEKMVGADFSTITACYENKRYDEQLFSDEVSRMTGFRAIKTFPQLDALLSESAWEKINYHQDQPTPSASHYSEYSVFKAARENQIIVMLDGQGADEYLGGYGEFFQHRLLELFNEMRWLACFKALQERTAYSGKSTYWEMKHFTRFISPAWLHKKSNPPSVLRQELAPRFEASAPQLKFSGIRALSIDEMQKSSIPYQLHSEDRNSMMFSIESRLPFLDPRLVAFGLGLPSAYKMKGARNKSVLRDTVPSLPASIRERKDKMGFVAPDDQWFIQNAPALESEMAKACRELESILNPALLPEYQEKIIRQQRYEAKFFRILSFYKWFQQFKPDIAS